MAGIYIHIPFCKSRCIYCGFFSTTSLSLRDEYVQALCRELEVRRDYLHGAPVETIYLGGGTPSLLSRQQIATLLTSLYNIYNVRVREITLECNPDDADETLAQLPALGINRLSLGLQTFDDTRLQFLRRRHTARQAIEAVAQAKSVGFDNISIDLMFGFPGQTLDQWKADVDQAIALDVQHLSAYSLMYEEGTPLERMLRQGDIRETDEETSLAMYEYLIEAMKSAGFEHYEISNFARPGKRSLHNSSYWRGIPYLGIGAGAHSFDGQARQSNPESLATYLQGAQSNHFAAETETLSPTEQYDEFVFTALRTCEGMSLATLRATFGDTLADYCLRNAHPHLQQGRLLLRDGQMRLTRKGLFVSNDIMSDLMWID